MIIYNMIGPGCKFAGVRGVYFVLYRTPAGLTALLSPAPAEEGLAAGVCVTMGVR